MTPQRETQNKRGSSLTIVSEWCVTPLPPFIHNADGGGRGVTPQNKITTEVTSRPAGKKHGKFLCVKACFLKTPVGQKTNVLNTVLCMLEMSLLVLLFPGLF